MEREEKDNMRETFLHSINFIHEVKIFNEIQNNKQILIFDFRKKEEYSRYNLENSLNIPYDQYDFEVFSIDHQHKWIEMAKNEEVKEMLKKYKRFYIVLIMSELKIPRKKILNFEVCEDESEKQIITKSLYFYKSLVDNRVRELGLFNLGFKKFVEHYKFIVCVKNCRPLAKDISNFPSEIFDHKIYIGNQNHALNDDIVNILKITHIINITKHVENAFVERGVKYLNIKIDDSPQNKISEYFKQVYEFIQEALTGGYENVEEDLANHHNKLKDYIKSMGIENGKSNDINHTLNLLTSWTYKNKILQILFKIFYSKYKSENRVLIHCSMGVSRSPAFIIMYVMKLFKLNLNQSLEFIKFQRDKSNPIQSFLDELEGFEQNQFCFNN